MLVREAQPCLASLSWCAVFRLVWVQYDRAAHCPVPRNVGFAPRCVHAFVPSLQASRRLEQLMCFFFPYNHAKNVKMLVSNCATQFVGCQICFLVWFYITGCWRFPHTCSLPLWILQSSWLQWQRVPLAASAWLDLR